MADETKKKIVIPVEADVKKADGQVDKFKKETEQQSVAIPVNVDMTDITKALQAIQGMVAKMEKAFDKDIKFSGLQKGLDDVLEKIKSVITTYNKGKPNEFQAFKVDLVGFKKLIDATEAIQSNIESLNDAKIDLSSFERLEETFKNIEVLINSIVKGMNFDSIRPSTQVQEEIESTTAKLETLAKQEKKISELENYLNKTGISKGKQIIEWGDSEDVNAIDNLIRKMKEYISLGGDLSKIKFKAPDTKELYSLADVLEILEDEGKIDFIDPSQISNDVEEVKTLRKELAELNKELTEAKIRENRDLNVSLDTKSVEDFAVAIQSAVQSIGQLTFNIPEGFKLDGLSTENLDKIIGKLDEIVITIGRIGDLLSTGVDTSKLQKGLQDNINNKPVKIDVSPEVDGVNFAKKIEEQLRDGNIGVVDVLVEPLVDSPIAFIESIEEQLAIANKNVKVDVLPNVKNDENDDSNFSIIDDSVIKDAISKIDDGFADISKNFGDDLMQTIEDFKETLASSDDIDYEDTFKHLRETLLSIVQQFQNSLKNVGLSSTQLNEAYETIKGWNDASHIMVSSGKKDRERSALIGKNTGKVSNSYLYDKEGEFSGQILDKLNKLSAGVSGEISEIYDTWLHSHPFKKVLEGLKTIGSDVGFSVDDFNVYMNKYLEKGITNMMVASNGKYTNIDWTGIVDKEVIKRVKENFAKSDIFVNGKFKGSLAESKGVYNFDKQTELINAEIIKAMSSAGIEDASSRLTTGNIEDLKLDMTQLQVGMDETQNDAQILYEVLDKISNALNDINTSGGFKFDGLDSLVISLEEVNRLLSEISNSIKTNVNNVPNIASVQSQIEEQQELRSELERVEQQAEETATALSQENQSTVLSGNKDVQPVIEGQEKIQAEISETEKYIEREKKKLERLGNLINGETNFKGKKDATESLKHLHNTLIDQENQTGRYSDQTVVAYNNVYNAAKELGVAQSTLDKNFNPVAINNYNKSLEQVKGSYNVTLQSIDLFTNKVQELNSQLNNSQKIEGANQSSVLSGNQTEVLSGDAKQAIEAQQKLQDELDETKEKIITLYRGISKDFVIGDLQVKTPHNNYGTFFSDTLKNSLQAYTGISKQDDKIIYKLELPESILNKMLQIDAKGKSYSDVDTDGLAEQYSKDGKTIGYVVKNCIDGIEELQTTVSIFDEKLLATAKLMSSQEIKDSGVHNYNFSDYFQEYSTSSTLEDEKSALLEIQKIINSIQKGKPIDFPITDDHESFVKSLKYLEALRNNLIELGYRWNDNEDNTYSIIPIDDHAITNGEEMKRILVDINSLSPKVNQTPLSSPSMYEDSDGQLSFVEQTKKTVDLIEEESGQMSMFENVAEKATDSAIEGQMTLNDVLNKNIEGQMTLNDLVAKQDATAPVVEPIKDTFDVSTSDTFTEQHTSDIKSETDAIKENTDALKENAQAQKKQSETKEGASDTRIHDVNKAWTAAVRENKVFDENKTRLAIKNYEELIGKLERYYSLLGQNNRNDFIDGSAEKAELESLKNQIDEASKSIDEFKGKGKDFNEIVKKFKISIGELDKKSGLTDLYRKDGRNDIFENLSSDNVVSSKINGYEQKVNDLKTVFLEIKNLVPIDITNQKEVDRLDELNKQFDELAQNLNSDKYDPANQSDINKWTGKISDTLFKNTNAPKEIRRDMEALVEQLKQVGLSQADIRRIKEEFERLESQMKATGKTGDSLGTKIKKKFKDVAAYFATYVSIQDAIQVIRQGFETIKEYDTALTEMNKVSDESIQTLKEFQKESFGLADSIGTTASQIQNSTADWMRLGESLEEAKQSAQDANILFNVSEFGSIDEATESLVSMSQAYKELEKGEIIDVVNNLGNNFAISTDGLATALQNSASALKTAQNDFYESAALTTAANTVVQDPDKVGAGLRTIALRLTGTEAAREELAALGEDVDDFVVTTTSKLDQQIKDLTKTQGNFGVSLLDMNGNYRSTYEVLLDIAKVWDKIAEEDLVTGENRQNALLEMMAGKNRSNILASVLQSPEVLEEAYSYALDSEGSAMRENEAYLESIEAHLSQLKNAWDSLWINENNREVITFFLDLAKSILEAVNEFGVLNTLLVGGGGIFAGFQAFKKDGRLKKSSLIFM